MAESHADFTLTFRRLCDAAAGPEGDARCAALFADPAPMMPGPRAGASGWREEPEDAAARRAAMRAVNPAYHPAQSSGRGGARGGGRARVISRRSRNC